MTYAEFLASPMLANYAAQENARTGAKLTPQQYAGQVIQTMDAVYGHQWNRPIDAPPPAATGIGGGPTAAGYNQSMLSGNAVPPAAASTQQAPGQQVQTYIQQQAAAPPPSVWTDPGPSTTPAAPPTVASALPGGNTGGPVVGPFAPPVTAVGTGAGTSVGGPPTTNGGYGEPGDTPGAVVGTGSSGGLAGGGGGNTGGDGTIVTGGTTTGGGAVGGGGAGGGVGNTIVETGLGTFRDLGSEGANTLQAQALLAPQMFDLYKQFLPQYSQVELTNLRNTMFGSVDAGQFLAAHPEFQQGYDEAKARGEDPQAWLDQVVGTSTYIDQSTVPRGGGTFGINQALTQAANEQTIRSNTALRQANLGDAQAMGSGALSLLKQLNPEQYASLAQIQQTAGQGIAPSQYQNKLGSMFAMGPQFQNVSAQQIGAIPNVREQQIGGLPNVQTAPSGLGMDLTAMARQQLALGGQISDWERQQAEQAAREAWSARGLAYSPGAVGAEILNRDDLQRQRLRERQAFAGQVEQLGQSQQGLGLQAQMANLGATIDSGRANQGANLQAQALNLGAGLDAARANQGANLQGQLANQGAGLQAQQQQQALGLSLLGTDYQRQQQNFGNQMANAQLQSAAAFNPFGTITGWGTANQGVNQTLFGQGAGVTSGGTGNQNVQNMFDPMNGYAANLYGQNYAALNQSRWNAADASAGKAGGWLSAIGGIAGSVFGGPIGGMIGSGIGSMLGGGGPNYNITG